MLTPQDFRTAAMVMLPLSFGWKVFKLFREKRARKYVFTLTGDVETTKMMSDDRARDLNRWRRWLRRDGRWERPERTGSARRSRGGEPTAD